MTSSCALVVEKEHKFWDVSEMHNHTYARLKRKFTKRKPTASKKARTGLASSPARRVPG